DPLIERDLDAIPHAVREFRAEHSSHDLFLAIARFAVLAFAPSEHGKHALLACLSAYRLRDDPRYDELLIECAKYAAVARQPWSEPPILTPPSIDDAQPRDIDELRAAVAAGDLQRGERWLAARLADADHDLFTVACDTFEDLGHKPIVTRACLDLLPILGEKGRYALLRVAVWELVSYTGAKGELRESLDELLDHAIAEHGSLEAVHGIFLYDALHPSDAELPRRHDAPVYNLARDYGQTLKAHALARRLAHPRIDDFLAAVHHNLDHGESFEAWS
ncbi:MAG TPA: hypothetical protein VFN10_04135, partial [Thermoanaerobaculia bacterium]|nr:hypothetical protein [Thermoanaerobaculia bacterium]